MVSEDRFPAFHGPQRCARDTHVAALAAPEAAEDAPEVAACERDGGEGPGERGLERGEEAEGCATRVSRLPFFFPAVDSIEWWRLTLPMLPAPLVAAEATLPPPLVAADTTLPAPLVATEATLLAPLVASLKMLPGALVAAEKTLPAPEVAVDKAPPAPEVITPPTEVMSEMIEPTARSPEPRRSDSEGEAR